MKIIIAGATGLVGSELVKQSLYIPEITSVIALARKPVRLDGQANSSKVKSVVVKDYGEYPDEVKAEFTGADACIWYGLIQDFHTKTHHLLTKCAQDCGRDTI